MLEDSVKVLNLFDEGELVSIVNRNCGEKIVVNLRSALELQETGIAIGKTVLADSVTAD